MAAEAETLTLDSPPPQSQPEKVSVSFSIWPPTQRTRDAVLSRLIETLSLRPLRALQMLRPEQVYFLSNFIKPLLMGYNTRQGKQHQLDEHVNLMEAQFAYHFSAIDDQLMNLKETISELPELRASVEHLREELTAVRQSLAEMQVLMQ
ncbi:hypothetical protein RJ640_012516 [Escallonia rubra]|uniref:WPP domain-containing protein n=1 Tax=Escallonia rubra TaxID=112253 RepID=A0AA88URJ3_9ASTE|nr:hypothetical protein RJ640_012516 [Escallonia rubra]